MDIKGKEKIYNKITQYYDFADELIQNIEEVDGRNIEDKIAVLEPMIRRLEGFADNLTEQYIQFIKTNDGSKSVEEIKADFNKLIAKIDECKDRVYKLYSKKDDS